MWQGACESGVATVRPATKVGDGQSGWSMPAAILPPWVSVDWRQHCNGYTDRPTYARLKPKGDSESIALNNPMANVSESPTSVCQHHSGGPM